MTTIREQREQEDRWLEEAARQRRKIDISPEGPRQVWAGYELDQVPIPETFDQPEPPRTVRSGAVQALIILIVVLAILGAAATLGWL